MIVTGKGRREKPVHESEIPMPWPARFPSRLGKKDTERTKQTFRAQRLAFSANAFMRCEFMNAVFHIWAARYRGLEIMADVPHAWPAGMGPTQLQDLKRILSSVSIQIANVNAFMMRAISDPRQPYWHPSWIEPDKHYRQIRIDHTKRALDLAKELGAPCITTEPGGPLEPGQRWSNGLKIFLEGFKPVAEHAEKIGVQLLVEPEPELLIETADQFEEFMKHIDCPAVGLNFDVGHFYCVKDEPGPTIIRLAKYIRHVHLEDIAATRVHHHLIPGDGAIDFVSIFRALNKIKYEGWTTVELYPYVDNPVEAAQIARQRLLAVLAVV